MSNFQREKPLHPGFLEHKASIPRVFKNYFFRNPAFPSRWGYGSCGSNNIPYSSPHSAVVAKRSWRTCSTDPDKRTAESCEDHPY